MWPFKKKVKVIEPEVLNISEPIFALEKELQIITELRKALEDIRNIPFVTPQARYIAGKALLATKQVSWIANDGI